MALWGKTDAQISVPKFLKRGQVLTVKVNGGGTGYTNGATATFSAPSSGITATGTVSVTGGVITGVNITNPGAGYTSAPTVTVAGGSGATFTVVIESIVVPSSEIVFVDMQEAQVPANRLKGIKTPGWTRVKSKIDNTGTERFFVEPLVAMRVDSEDSGDASDDAVVGDNDSFAISSQPSAVTVAAPTATSFSVMTSEATYASLNVVFTSMTNGQTTVVNGATMTATGAVAAGNAARAFFQYIKGETITPAVNATFSGTFTSSTVEPNSFSFDDATVGFGAIQPGYLQAIASQVTLSGTASASVGTSNTGSNGTGSFQWQVRVNNTGAFTNISNAGVYTGATTFKLSISNTTGLNNNRYRCVCLNSDTNTTITTKAVKLTVTA